MFTHQTPEPRYMLDPQGVCPHLRGRTTPRQQPLRTQDPAPHTPSPNSSAQPLHQQPRSKGGGTETVNRNAEATARLLKSVYAPSVAAPELRHRLRLGPLRPLSVTASRSGKMAADGGGGRGSGGGGGGRGGGKCTGPARPAPQGQRGRGRSCPPPFCLWAAARRYLSTAARRQPTGGRAVDRISVYFTTDAFNNSPKATLPLISPHQHALWPLTAVMRENSETGSYTPVTSPSIFSNAFLHQPESTTHDL
ncbi:uncharacterized protein AAG666_020336 isoform 1-T4 [Megaptera novaeangliae]